MIMRCNFVEDGTVCVCLRCGRTVVARNCSRLIARCPQNDGTCIHRGDKSRPVKVECCGGKNRMEQTYRCTSLAVPQRLCILTGTIAQEHERQLVAVCDGCRVRQSP